MGGAGARANAAALDTAFAAELDLKNVGDPHDDPANAGQPPGAGYLRIFQGMEWKFVLASSYLFSYSMSQAVCLCNI